MEEKEKELEEVLANFKEVLDELKKVLSYVVKERPELLEEELRPVITDAWEEIAQKFDTSNAEMDNLQKAKAIDWDKLEQAGLRGSQWKAKFTSFVQAAREFWKQPLSSRLRGRFFRRVDIILGSINSILPVPILEPIIEFKETVEEGSRE